MRDETRERPWTPGPWAVPEIQPMPEVYAGPSPRDAVAKCYPQADKTQANAALIALAPEMAEAILSWRECADGLHQGCRCADELDAIADKLRAIGASDD